MHVKIVTFTRESTDVPFFTRERDMHFYFTTLHLDGKILLEKRSFSDDMLVYTRETHWKSKEEYDTMREFRKARDKYLCENNIVMTDVS
jgi:hypothetical protein